ncbi:transportin-3-like [Mustelus asterias]
MARRCPSICSNRREGRRAPRHWLGYRCLTGQHREDFELRKNLVHGFLGESGALLVAQLVQACCFYLVPSMLGNVADVMWELRIFDRKTFCRWLEDALKALPKELSAGAITATEKQVTEFHKQVMCAEDASMIGWSLMEFSGFYR